MYVLIAVMISGTVSLPIVPRPWLIYPQRSACEAALDRGAEVAGAHAMRLICIPFTIAPTPDEKRG